MPSSRYILVCTINPEHRRFVQHDAWVWIPTADFHSLMPRDYLDEKPTGKQLKRCQCEDCGAAVTFREQQDQED
jgi:hypothetical protein